MTAEDRFLGSRISAMAASWSAFRLNTQGVESIYLRLQCLLLLGYALFGKPFAYLGIGKVFVGELFLATGSLIMFVSPRAWGGVKIRNLVPLYVLMIWCALRTFPFVPQYGLTALRDGAIWGYGWFAVLIAIAVVSRPTTVSGLLDRYSVFVRVFLGFAPLVWASARLFGWWGQTSGGQPVSVLKATDMTVHLSGAVAFICLGIRRVSGMWLLLVPVVIATALGSRAAIMTALISVTVLALLRPGTPKLLILTALLALALTVAASLEISVRIPGSRRELSANSTIRSLSSVFRESGVGDYDATRKWRLTWWRKIFNYTFGGQYFLGGKGFGVNLADSDGFVVDREHSLRSPHNGHLTFLARAGVPGFTLWLIVQGCWGYSTFVRFRECSRRGPKSLGHVFLFLLTYWVAFLVSASFDVFLEGPMAGIWFWTLFGLGVGLTTIYDRVYRRPPHACVP